MRFSSRNNTHKIYDDDVIVDTNNNARGTSETTMLDIDDGHDHRNDSATLRQVSGAAVVGGIVGCCLLGPLVGIVAAGGAAVLATSPGSTGTVARSTGDVAADAGKRLNDLNKKHHIVEKTSKGIVKGCRWVSDQLKEKPSPGGTNNK
jgi:hypothetical protein